MFFFSRYVVVATAAAATATATAAATATAVAAATTTTTAAEPTAANDDDDDDDYANEYDLAPTTQFCCIPKSIFVVSTSYIDVSNSHPLTVS